jgi:hypothetical protein
MLEQGVPVGWDKSRLHEFPYSNLLLLYTVSIWSGLARLWESLKILYSSKGYWIDAKTCTREGKGGNRDFKAPVPE